MERKPNRPTPERQLWTNRTQVANQDIRELEHTFFSDVAQADEIGLASWRNRSPRLRLVHWLARLLDHQS